MRLANVHRSQRSHTIEIELVYKFKIFSENKCVLLVTTNFKYFNNDNFFDVSLIVDEVVMNMMLVGDKEPVDGIGELSVCLDGMQVDPELLTNGDTPSMKSE